MTDNRCVVIVTTAGRDEWTQAQELIGAVDSASSGSRKPPAPDMVAAEAYLWEKERLVLRRTGAEDEPHVMTVRWSGHTLVFIRDDVPGLLTALREVKGQWGCDDVWLAGHNLERKEFQAAMKGLRSACTLVLSYRGDDRFTQFEGCMAALLTALKPHGSMAARGREYDALLAQMERLGRKPRWELARIRQKCYGTLLPILMDFRGMEATADPELRARYARAVIAELQQTGATFSGLRTAVCTALIAPPTTPAPMDPAVGASRWEDRASLTAWDLLDLRERGILETLLADFPDDLFTRLDAAIQPDGSAATLPAHASKPEERLLKILARNVEGPSAIDTFAAWISRLEDTADAWVQASD